MESRRYFLMTCMFATVLHILCVAVTMAFKGDHILFNEILSGRRNCEMSINRQEFEGCKDDSHFPDASSNSILLRDTPNWQDCGMLNSKHEIERHGLVKGTKYDSPFTYYMAKVGKKYTDTTFSSYHYYYNKTQIDTNRYQMLWNMTGILDIYDEINIEWRRKNNLYTRTNLICGEAYSYFITDMDGWYNNLDYPLWGLYCSTCLKDISVYEVKTSMVTSSRYSINIERQEDLNKIQVMFSCSVIITTSRTAKWCFDVPKNESILIEVDISSYTCIFMKENVNKNVVASNASLSEFKLIRCLQEDGNMQEFEFNANSTIRCENDSQVVVYMFISYFIFTIIVGVYICRKARLCHAIVHKLKSFGRKRNKGQVYTFDAFISYSHSDIDWVLKFYNKLHSFGHSISFDEKDFLVGAFISDNIYHTLGKSRKVIFIITEHFLESTWGEFELEVARTYALDNGRHNMIIVVVKDDIDINRMPNVLKDIWYKTTCIKWFKSKDKQEDDYSKHEDKCIRKVNKAISVYS